MTSEYWLLASVFTIGLISIVGFFTTKTKGFGRYATSTFLILITIIIASLLFSTGKLEKELMGNLIFAVIGFSGGLFIGKE